MSLRKQPLISKEVLAANDALIWAVDTEDDAKLMEIAAGSIRPNQEGINQAFLLAVDHKCASMVKIFTSATQDALKPEQCCIDTALMDLADEGVDVPLIAMLQEHASWKALQELNRHINAKRKDGNRAPYLVTMTEGSTMEEIQQRQEKHKARMSKSLNVKSRFEVIMSDQRWINRTFSDAAHSHLKLTVLRLLTVPADNFNILRPDQTTINDTFAFCVRKGYLSMARLLLNPPHPATLSVDQQGFDRGVLGALEDGCDAGICRWVFSGRHGFTPTLSVLDEVYLEHARRVSPDRRVVDGFDVESAVQWAVHDELARQFRQQGLGHIRIGGWRPPRQRFSQIQRAAIKEHAHSQKLVKVLASHVSEEAKQTITREYARATARQRAMAVFRHNSHSVDIHNFSDTAVDTQLDGLGLIDVDMVMEEDGEDDDENEGNVGNAGPEEDIGELVAAPPDVPALPDQEGIAVRNPWEAPPQPPRRAVAGAAAGAVTGSTASRPLSVHDAVVQNLERRVGQDALSSAQVMQRMSELIETHFTSQAEQTRTMRIVSEGMSDTNFRVLGLALQFLHTHHPGALGMWVQGFLAESIAVNSCQAGAMERIVTGLRGVEDAELQQIFAQAEGPNLARIFLTGTFNIYFNPNDERSVATARQNAMHLAEVLVDAGVDADTPAEEVTQRLAAYARARVAEYGVRVEGRLAQEIDRVVETVGDGYEDYLLPTVREMLQRRSETTAAAAGPVDADTNITDAGAGAAPMELELNEDAGTGTGGTGVSAANSV